MSKTLKFNLDTLKLCIENGISESDNNHTIDIHYNVVVELFEPTYKEQIMLFCELLFEGKTELEYLVILYKCIEKYIHSTEECISVPNRLASGCELINFEEITSIRCRSDRNGRRFKSLVERSAHRISFALYRDEQYLKQSDFGFLEPKDLQYILSLDLDDDLLFKFLIETTKRYSYAKENAKVLVENVKSSLINRLFTDESVMGHDTLDESPVLSSIIANHPVFLSNDAFKCALSRVDSCATDFVTNKTAIRLLHILESEEVCCRDIYYANLFGICSISDTSYLIDLFKNNSDSCRSNIISLLLGSEKFDDVRTLINILEEESRL